MSEKYKSRKRPYLFQRLWRRRFFAHLLYTIDDLKDEDLDTAASFNLIKTTQAGVRDDTAAKYAALAGGDQLIKIRGTESLEVEISGTVDSAFPYSR